MESWGKQTVSQIDEKLKNTQQRDIRYFRIEEFKRNVFRVDEFSTNCPVCRKQKIDVNGVVANIDEAINTPGARRREYDRLISRLASHMQKEHGFYAPFYFTYLFSFFGMAAGIVIGSLLLKIFPAEGWALLTLGFVAGLTAGYVWGGIKDGKIRSSKKLM